MLSFRLRGAAIGLLTIALDPSRREGFDLDVWAISVDIYYIEYGWGGGALVSIGGRGNLKPRESV